METAANQIIIKAVLILSLLFAFQGCDVGIFRCPEGPDTGFIKSRYLRDVLVVGTSTKQDIRAKLGEPYLDFPEDGMCVYKLLLKNDKLENAGDVKVITKPTDKRDGDRYSLVLEFNEKGILLKEKVMQVR